LGIEIFYPAILNSGKTFFSLESDDRYNVASTRNMASSVKIQFEYYENEEPLPFGRGSLFNKASSIN